MFCTGDLYRVTIERRDFFVGNAADAEEAKTAALEFYKIQHSYDENFISRSISVEKVSVLDAKAGKAQRDMFIADYALLVKNYQSSVKALSGMNV